MGGWFLLRCCRRCFRCLVAVAGCVGEPFQECIVICHDLSWFVMLCDILWLLNLLNLLNDYLAQNGGSNRAFWMSPLWSPLVAVSQRLWCSLGDGRRCLNWSCRILSRSQTAKPSCSCLHCSDVWVQGAWKHKTLVLQFVFLRLPFGKFRAAHHYASFLEHPRLLNEILAVPCKRNEWKQCHFANAFLQCRMHNWPFLDISRLSGHLINHTCPLEEHFGGITYN